MEVYEIEAESRDKHGQALQEFQRAHHKMGGPIAVRGFELKADLDGRGAALGRHGDR